MPTRFRLQLFSQSRSIYEGAEDNKNKRGVIKLGVVIVEHIFHV